MLRAGTGRLSVLATAFCGCLLLLSPGAAASTHLDRHFGRDGIAAVAGESTPRLAKDRSGRLIVAEGTRRSFLISRFTERGDLDPSFGRRGTAEVDLSEFVRRPNAEEEEEGSSVFPVGAVATRRDGGVLVSGVAMYRLLPNGRLDRDFGRRLENPQAPPQLQTGIEVDSILPRRHGFFLGGSYTRAVVARYGEDGILDRDFGTGRRGGRTALPPKPKGKTRYRLDAGFSAVVPGPGGTVYAAGEANRSLLLTRLEPDGSLDRSFAGGFVRLNAAVRRGCGCTSVAGAAVDRYGRVLVAGSLDRYTNRSLHRRAFVARFLSDGRLDRSFGQGGFARFSADADGANRVNGIAIDRRGRIVLAAGSANLRRSVNGGPGSFTLFRLLPDGRRDRSFYGDGVFKSFFGGVEAEALTPLIDRAGGLVVAGVVAKGVRFQELRSQGFLVRFRGGSLDLRSPLPNTQGRRR